MELLLSLVTLVLAPLLVHARVQLFPGSLVHEEHLPPIRSEPTFTLGRFVDELLKMRGRELYPNAIRGSRPRKRPIKLQPPSPFTSSNSQQKNRIPPNHFHNVRINNRPFYPKNWSAYTQVIFHPVRSEVLDITLSPSLWDYAEYNTVEKITNATKTAPLKAKAASPVAKAETYPSPRQDEFQAVAAPAAINGNLIERSIKVEPNTDLQTSSTTSSSSFTLTPSFKLLKSINTTTDLVDELRRDLKARKPLTRPFVATGKIFKKRNNQWTPVESSSAAKNYISMQKMP